MHFCRKLSYYGLDVRIFYKFILPAIAVIIIAGVTISSFFVFNQPEPAAVPPIQSPTPSPEDGLRAVNNALEQYLNENLALEFLPKELSIQDRKVKSETQGQVYFVKWKVGETAFITTLSFNANDKDIKKIEIGIRLPKMDLTKKTAISAMKKFFKAVPEETEINCKNVGKITLCEKFQTNGAGYKEGVGVASPFELESTALVFVCKIPNGSEYSSRQSCRDSEELRL